ncbi:50S ribosomal protein L4 [Candidatus Uhrbacteria bacterium RIFCSPHIGHO2_12_FULL_54_23]|uniref:Large ribosomal subunit protein uL4 n=2 Tax=Candidatus Uhriibacteriota TaxID=1752732 RepID=A0A1F7UI98_9BACT|nr:MAG: 50S ribosomal protein L4 [Candidatus Uhrbacteria bacterium RIFCSPHIGHO2_12_FULL_54_23]OGL90005.1 MAG: 50S ribosomal protein L4 [Candidatus Uhrbacteria bacterium RIFCSPLOWO2_02_FULL_54_37]
MLKAHVYNLDGSVAQEIDLPKEVFGARVDRELLHRVLTAREFSRRGSVAHTQTRGEVRGGGRKPWRQKGTGRARQGSIRSPQWKGGGVVFGPRSERNWERKVNEKVARKALASALSGKWKGSRLAWLHAFPLSAPKTKQFVELMTQAKAHVPALVHAAWGDSRRHEMLLLTAGANAALTRASRNVPGIKAVSVQDAALEDAVGYKYIIATPDVIPVLLKRCARSKK